MPTPFESKEKVLTPAKKNVLGPKMCFVMKKDRKCKSSFHHLALACYDYKKNVLLCICKLNFISSEASHPPEKFIHPHS